MRPGRQPVVPQVARRFNSRLDLENPTALLEIIKKRAVGFFAHSAQKATFHKSDACVGIDLGQSHLTLVALKMDSGKPQITHFFVRERPPTPEALTEEIRSLVKDSELNPRNVRIALKGQGVVIRNITFPKMKREEFTSAISYEIEKYIPFKACETQYDFQIIRDDITKGDSELMNVLLVAVKQPEIYQLLRIFQSADMQVGLIDISAFALANSVQYLHPEVKQVPIGFLDMGAESTTFGVLLRGDPIFIRDIPFGGADILRYLKRRLNLESDASLATLRGSLNPSPEYQKAVESALEPFAKELKLSLSYYLDRVTGAEPIECLFLAGRGTRFLQHSDYLQREIQLSIRRPEIFSKIGVAPRIENSGLRQNEDIIPVALGLCLRP